MDRTPAGATTLPHQGQGLTSGPRGVAPRMGSGTDRRKGRAGVRNGAVRRAGPELLNWSRDQIRAGPGAGAGVGPAGGRAGPGRAAPSLLSAGAKLCVNGGPGGGPAGKGGGGGGNRPMGAWSASPRCRDWRNSDRGWGIERPKRSLDRRRHRAARNSRRQRPRQARGKETKRRSVKR